MDSYLNMAKILHLQGLDELAKANMLVLIVFNDKKDKAGVPYIRHLNKVSESFRDDKGKCVALLHDIVLNTSFTFDDLIALGFSKDVIEALKLLTNDLGDYDKYIDRLINSDNILAKKVKIADLLDNMNLNRFEELDKTNFDRIRNKYIKTYIKLIDDLEGRILK